MHRIHPQAEMLLVNRRLTDTPEELKDQHEDQEEEENAEDQANRQAGVPTESGSAWLKQKRVRARRALRFLEDKASTFKMLVWMALGTPLQILHFQFFKCGSVGGKDSDGHNALFDCISFPRSRPLKIMQKIGLSLRLGTAEEAETWGLTTSFFGLPFSWDQAQKKQASTCAWRILGNLYRRFVVRLHAWPWRLAGMVDSRLSNDERAKVAHDYVKANRCCLEPLFGKKFRDACITEEGGPTVADIMLQPILAFYLQCSLKPWHRPLTWKACSPTCGECSIEVLGIYSMLLLTMCCWKRSGCGQAGLAVRSRLDNSNGGPKQRCVVVGRYGPTGRRAGAHCG